MKPVIVLLLFAVLTACTANPDSDRQFVEFKIIEHGQVSGITFQKFFEIRDAEEFNDFWTIHSQPTRVPLPKIDFKQDMVIAVFYGQQQTGGYDIYIHNIEEQETELLVNMRTIEPKANSNLTMMISQPHMIIRIPKTDKTLQFVFKR